MNKKELDDLNELFSVTHDLTFVYYAMIDHQAKHFSGDDKKYSDFSEGVSVAGAICAGVSDPLEEHNGKALSVEFRLGMIAGLAIGTTNIYGTTHLLYDILQKHPQKNLFEKIRAKSIIRFIKLLHERIVRFIESTRNQISY